VRALLKNPHVVDGLLAAALCALVVDESLFADITTPRGLAVAVGIAMTVPLVLRRRYPLAVTIAVFGAFAVLGLADSSKLPPQSVLLALAAAAWSVGAYAPRNQARIGLAVCFAGLLLNEAGDFIVLGPLTGGVWAVGRLFRDRHRWATELQERGAALEREQAEETRLAIAEERARIARELHDVVAHHVSVMVMQAGAERMAVSNERPDTAATLETIEQTGREALGEMRRLLGLLRREDEEIALAPQPSLERLEELAQHVTAAGLPVELEVTGERRPVAPGVDISGYRIVQEALTNALRHAGPASALVVVDYQPDHIEIDVSDDGRGALAHARYAVPVAIRIGLAAAVFGGSLEAGPRPQGGFRVRTRLPLEGSRP
jgi:signal transduction histidine kinase